MANTDVEDFYRWLRLSTAEDIVATTNGSQVAVIKGNNSGARPSNLEWCTSGPPIEVGVKNLTALQSFHRCLPWLSIWLERAASDDIDLAPKRSAAMAPTSTRERLCTVLLPAWYVRVVDVAACEKTFGNASLVVPTHNNETAIWQHSSSASCPSGGHGRASDPTTVPCVKHLHRVERAFSLVAAAESIEHIWQGTIEAQEGCHQFSIKSGWQWSSLGTRRFSLLV